MKKLFRLFIQGLVYIGPIGITLYAIYFIFSFFDNLLRNYILEWLGVDIPGLGVVVIFVFITLLDGSGRLLLPVRLAGL